MKINQCPTCGNPMYVNEGGDNNYLACSACGTKILLMRAVESLTPLHTPKTLKKPKSK